MPTDYFTEGGYGGGYDDSHPLSDVSSAFMWNLAKLTHDIWGDGGILRANVKLSYDQATDSWGAWNFGNIDRLVAAAAFWRCQVLLSINVASPTSPSKIPRVVGGRMPGWRSHVPAVFTRYAGTNAQLGPGSTVTMDSTMAGRNVTIPADWPGVKWFEGWNEPNQIGSCGGALAQGGSNQGLPWYQLVFLINDEIALAAQAHSQRSQFNLAAVTMGGLEPDFLFAVSGKTPNGVAEYAASHGNWDALFDAFSMHCYMLANPMTAVGGLSNRGVLDTIRTHIRGKTAQNPGVADGLNDFGFTAQKIWITEAGNGGSLNAGSSVELWNQNKHTAVDLAGDGASHTANSGKAITGDVHWGHKFGDAGADAAQGADPDTGGTQLSQPFVLRNYIRKLRSLNVDDDCRVEMLTFHMGIRRGALTWSKVITSGGYPYWQDGRAISHLATCDTNENAYIVASGSPFRSPSWFPAGGYLRDEWAPAVSNKPPTVSITSPLNNAVVETSTVTLLVTATDPNGLQSAEYRVDPGTGTFGAWTAMSIASGGGSTSVHYTASVAINRSGSGTNNLIQARATDNSGAHLVSTSNPQITVKGVVGNQPPVLVVSVPSGNTTVSNATTTQTVSGNATDPA